MACVFAATYPERTRALLLWGVQARWTKTPDYPWGLSREDQQRMVKQLAEEGLTRSYITGPGAGAGKGADPAYVDWFVRYGRAGASPAAMAALETVNAEIDTRDVLPTIRVPTLVMNRTGDPVANVYAARDVASRIPGQNFSNGRGRLTRSTTWWTRLSRRARNSSPGHAPKPRRTECSRRSCLSTSSNQPGRRQEWVTPSGATCSSRSMRWAVGPLPATEDAKSRTPETASSLSSTGRRERFSARDRYGTPSRSSDSRAGPVCVPESVNSSRTTLVESRSTSRREYLVQLPPGRSWSPARFGTSWPVPLSNSRTAGSPR